LSELRFYLDENVDLRVTQQLIKANIDAVSVRDLDELGDEDMSHLQRATKMGRVLCTHDQDFLRIATNTIDHCGIIFAPQYGSTVGAWFHGLMTIFNDETTESMQGQVRFLVTK
jgi:hypothetical protein